MIRKNRSLGAYSLRGPGRMYLRGNYGRRRPRLGGLGFDWGSLITSGIDNATKIIQTKLSQPKVQTIPVQYAYAPQQTSATPAVAGALANPALLLGGLALGGIVLVAASR